MWRGLYTAAAGMVTEMTRTDTIANNLANANSTAFKKDQTLSGEFEPMLIRRINDDAADNATSFKGFSVGTEAPVVGELGLGSYTRGIATDFAQGSMQTTGNPLDLAISGAGYFAVQTPDGVRYTRAGNFYRSSAGQLETVDGQPVLNRQGRPVTLPGNATSVQFGKKGEIFVDHQQVDQLQFVQFNDNRNLLKQGNSLYYTQNGAQPQPATGEIQQGMLEHSNVNVISDMVSLINNYRMYEAGSKAVTTQDSMLDKSVNEVGRMT